MQTPIEVDFQGLDATAELRETIAKHVGQFEERFGRLTAVRVAVKAPSGHHQTGGLYEINIRLGVPEGRDVNIDRTPQNDERYADVNFALNDAFKRALRQLADHVDRMKGQVKHHDGPVRP